MIKALIFDWGDTVMRDFGLPGPMHLWDKVEWVPGAEKLLQDIHENFTCIIATSADHSYTPEMIMALERLGAEKYFQKFFSQKELGVKKPDPRFFKSVIKQSGFKESDCVMIGNSYEKDIAGAKKAGLKTIFFNEFIIEGDFPDADAMVYQLHEITTELIQTI